MHSVIRESEIVYLCNMFFSQIWFIFMKIGLYWNTGYQLLPIVSQGFEPYFLIFGSIYLKLTISQLSQSHFLNGLDDTDLPKIERLNFLFVLLIQ